MTLREKLLKNQPKIHAITLMGEEYFIKSLSVGEMNRQIFTQRQDLIALAKKAGVALPDEDDEKFDDVLEKFAQQYQLPRAMASRLCDEKGELQFDMDNLDDLNQLASLDMQVIADFNQAMARFSPKASVSEESSS